MEGRVTAKIPLGGTLGRLTSGLTELFGTFHWSLVWGEVRLPEKGLMDKWGVAVICFKFKRPRKDRNVQRSGVWEESACACECRSERALWTWWPGCRGSGEGGGSWGWGSGLYAPTTTLPAGRSHCIHMHASFPDDLGPCPRTAPQSLDLLVPQSRVVSAPDLVVKATCQYPAGFFPQGTFPPFCSV